jgi:hypothetical protein
MIRVLRATASEGLRRSDSSGPFPSRAPKARVWRSHLEPPRRGLADGVFGEPLRHFGIDRLCGDGHARGPRARHFSGA